MNVPAFLDARKEDVKLLLPHLFVTREKARGRALHRRPSSKPNSLLEQIRAVVNQQPRSILQAMRCVRRQKKHRRVLPRFRHCALRHAPVALQSLVAVFRRLARPDQAAVVLCCRRWRAVVQRRRRGSTGVPMMLRRHNIRRALMRSGRTLIDPPKQRSEQVHSEATTVTVVLPSHRFAAKLLHMRCVPVGLVRPEISRPQGCSFWECIVRLQIAERLIRKQLHRLVATLRPRGPRHSHQHDESGNRSSLASSIQTLVVDRSDSCHVLITMSDEEVVQAERVSNSRDSRIPRLQRLGTRESCVVNWLVTLGSIAFRGPDGSASRDPATLSEMLRCQGCLYGVIKRKKQFEQEEHGADAEQGRSNGRFTRNDVSDSEWIPCTLVCGSHNDAESTSQKSSADGHAEESTQRSSNDSSGTSSSMAVYYVLQIPLVAAQNRMLPEPWASVVQRGVTAAFSISPSLPVSSSHDGCAVNRRRGIDGDGVGDAPAAMTRMTLLPATLWYPTVTCQRAQLPSTPTAKPAEGGNGEQEGESGFSPPATTSLSCRVASLRLLCSLDNEATVAQHLTKVARECRPHPLPSSATLCGVGDCGACDLRFSVISHPASLRWNIGSQGIGYADLFLVVSGCFSSAHAAALSRAAVLKAQEIVRAAAFHWERECLCALLITSPGLISSTAMIGRSDYVTLHRHFGLACAEDPDACPEGYAMSVTAASVLSTLPEASHSRGESRRLTDGNGRRCSSSQFQAATVEHASSRALVRRGALVAVVCASDTPRRAPVSGRRVIDHRRDDAVVIGRICHVCDSLVFGKRLVSFFRFASCCGTAEDKREDEHAISTCFVLPATTQLDQLRQPCRGAIRKRGRTGDVIVGQGSCSGGGTVVTVDPEEITRCVIQLC